MLCVGKSTGTQKIAAMANPPVYIMKTNLFVAPFGPNKVNRYHCLPVEQIEENEFSKIICGKIVEKLLKIVNFSKN